MLIYLLRNLGKNFLLIGHLGSFQVYRHTFVQLPVLVGRLNGATYVRIITTDKANVVE